MVRTWDGQVYENYSDYLQSKHWKRVRQRALIKTTRSGTGCVYCHRKSNLDVTHKKFRRSLRVGRKVIKNRTVLGRERLSDLRVICRDCHDLIKEHHLDTLVRSNKIQTHDQLLDAAGMSKRRTPEVE